MKKTNHPSPVGCLGVACIFCYTFATKNCFATDCYRLLQGKDKSNINEYVVFRDLFDNNKGLIIPWSQVRVLLGPPTQTVVKKGFEATHLTDKYINTNFEELRRALEKLD